ncbi:MAG: amidase [Idiomarina sp.]|nr:amidase [Idiomarina sp.]
MRHLVRYLALGLVSLSIIGCSPQTTETLPVDPAWLTAADIQMHFESGALTSEMLIQHYLERIEQLNTQGPELRAIIDIHPEALAMARERDAQRAQGEFLGPLHGFPVILKANIATNDGLPTTAGAQVLEGFTTDVDAELVAQLRAKGAIIIGKANLSEWANFRGQNSSSGWSGLGGQTRNPFLTTHTPCGSSSGSGVAVAADMAVLAIGTETDGSIMCPAAINGVVGMKSTRGSVSGHGIIPIASAQDIAGPMTRTVYGSALLLDAMSTYEARREYGIPLTEAVKAGSRVERVGVVRAYDQRFDGVAAMTQNIIERLRAQGIEVVEIAEWSLPNELYAAEIEVLIYEFQRDLNAWLSEFQSPAQAADMAAIIEYNLAHADQVLHLFGQEYFEAAVAVDLIEAEESYLQALTRGRELSSAHLDSYLVEQSLDLILMPSYGPAWPINHEDGDGFNFGTSTAAAVSGYPSLTLPAGQEGELPLGISIVGRPWSEALIFGFAGMLEAELGGFRQPQFIVPANEPN